MYSVNLTRRFLNIVGWGGNIFLGFAQGVYYYTMTATELIASWRKNTTQDVLASLQPFFLFKPQKKLVDNKAEPQVVGKTLFYGSLFNREPSESLIDANMDFRAEVVEALLYDFSIGDIQLIRALFDEEVACEMETWQHDNLHQLCYYLYELGQLEDTFRLYNAKFGIPHMDVGAFLDRALITVGHEPEEVINYLDQEFIKHPHLREEYPTIIEELRTIIEHPYIDGVAGYTRSIRGYFFGHKNVDKIFGGS